MTDSGPLSLPLDPFEALSNWLSAAAMAGEVEPTAMTLATVDSQGKPRARIVLYKGLVRNLLTFHTNYESQKGQDLESHGFAATVFYWGRLFRQLRVEGRVEKLSTAESDAYFQTRERGSQIGAWSSPQSSVIRERSELERRIAETERKFEGHIVPRPSNWGGYGIEPSRFEFWEGRTHRLHERYQYVREGNLWTKSQLAP